MKVTPRRSNKRSAEGSTVELPYLFAYGDDLGRHEYFRHCSWGKYRQGQFKIWVTIVIRPQLANRSSREKINLYPNEYGWLSNREKIKLQVIPRHHLSFICFKQKKKRIVQQVRCDTRCILHQPVFLFSDLTCKEHELKFIMGVTIMSPYVNMLPYVTFFNVAITVLCISSTIVPGASNRCLPSYLAHALRCPRLVHRGNAVDCHNPDGWQKYRRTQ